MGSPTAQLIHSYKVRAVILACWDNTMGPRTLKVWRNKHKKYSLEPELIQFVTRFTLIDEISREMELRLKTVEIKFNVLSDVGLMVLTCVFKSKMKTSTTIYTCSLLLNIEDLHYFTSINQLIREKMISMVKLLQKTLYLSYSQNNPDALESSVKQFELPLKYFILLYDTLLVNQTHSTSTKIHYLPLAQRNYFASQEALENSCFSSPPETKSERDFLAKVITSHLQTHGYTVVIGNQWEEINRWVDTLALLLHPQEQNTCKRILWNKTTSSIEDDMLYTSMATMSQYIPELHVQGLLLPSAKHLLHNTSSTQTNPSNSTNPSTAAPPAAAVSATTPTATNVSAMNFKEEWKTLLPIQALLNANYPVTVVDLAQKCVRRFKLYNYFHILKKDYMESIANSHQHHHSHQNDEFGHDYGNIAFFMDNIPHELLVLDYEATNHEDLPSTSSSNIGLGKKPSTEHGSYKDHFSHPSATATSVKKFMERLYSIPNHIRLLFIAEWMREWKRRAFVLSKFVETKNVTSPFAMNGPTAITGSNGPSNSNGSTSTGGNNPTVDVVVDDLNPRIQESLDITDKDDLYILLALAEKIWPGVYITVTGDPRVFSENVSKFLDDL